MKSHKIKIIISILLTVIFLIIAFKNIDFKTLLQTLKNMNFFWLIPFVGLTIFGMWIRAIRWKYLLKARGDFKASRLFSPLMIGFMANSLLPFRVGEFARAYTMGKKENFSPTTSFATIILERVFDGIALLACLAIVFQFMPIADTQTTLNFGKYELNYAMIKSASKGFSYMIFIVLIGVLMLAVEKTKDIMVSIINSFKFIPQKIRDFMINMVNKIAHGFHSIRDIKSTLWIIFYSFLTWIIVGFSLQMLSWGFDDISISFMQGMAVMIIICFAITIPSVPGYWGLYELGCWFGLTVLGIQSDKSIAMGYALILHSMQMFPIIIIGLYYLWKEGFSLKEISSNTTG